MNPGAIVRCRNRDWVLLPSDQADVYRLRPLTGATDDVVAIHRRLTDLIGYELPEERLRSAVFPRPSPDDLADDVGVGKTIEALLIARELLDRGEIKRLGVLCPPCLCEQWQRELAEKFNLGAVIIRSGTVGALERRKAGADSLYRHYPVQVASIDFLKSDRNRHLFLLDCPDLIIVDEAHGSAVAAESNPGQHQCHQLVREIAARADRHLILLTATPHSGIESAFRSLLGLLRPEFSAWDTAALTEPRRIELARHFVQRTRRDIENDWEGEHCFPRREAADETYRLSRPYRDLFTRTCDFCSEMVQSGQALARRQQRVRYWGALALLRCVMSSPAAAVASLPPAIAFALPAIKSGPWLISFTISPAARREILRRLLALNLDIAAREASGNNKM